MSSHLSTYWQHFVKYRPLIRELVSRDLAHRRFVHEAGVGVRGVDLRGGEYACAVQDDAVAFHVTEAAVFADDV